MRSSTTRFLVSLLLSVLASASQTVLATASTETVLLDTGSPPDRLATGTVIYSNQTGAIKFSVPSSPDATDAEKPMRLDSVEVFLSVTPDTNMNLTFSLCPDVDGGVPGGHFPTDGSEVPPSPVVPSSPTTKPHRKPTPTIVHPTHGIPVVPRPGLHTPVEKDAYHGAAAPPTPVAAVGRMTRRQAQDKAKACPVQETFLIAHPASKRLDIKWQPVTDLMVHHGKSYWFVLSSPATGDLGNSLSWLDSTNGTATIAFKEDGGDWMVSTGSGVSTARVIAV
ncbi:hypothetical protein HKX48_000343 [Thoreauomyces humboldtii]|nr:hypothetical protein HKX48_000343 [Thoreauomyces humboldtii]